MALLKLPADVINRPERRFEPPGSLEPAWQRLRARLSWPGWLRLLARRAMLPLIHRHARRVAELDAAGLNAYRDVLRCRLLAKGISPWRTAEAFALIREVAWRELGMAHHDVQLLGGLTLLAGQVAEMQTGEGKTLTATLPAATAALAGIPVHLVTVNDYLAGRDAESMRPIYTALGLSVGGIVHDLNPRQRRAVYAADVVYCTNKELLFDYLRDTQLLGNDRRPLMAQAARLQQRLDHRRLLLRGLHYAIIDEADSVMLDEAGTPLILSGPAPQDALDMQLIDELLALAGDFVEGLDFVREQAGLHLTDVGRERLEYQAESLFASNNESSGWLGRSRREWLLQQALMAHYHFQRDHHYLVRDGKVQIIDEHTGRVMADRSWEKGLQQMIERLEGCEPSDPNVTLARLTYQRFFRRYHHLAGMTGTAHEVRHELWRTYRLRTVPIPPHRRSRRRWLGHTCVNTIIEKWQRVAVHARQRADQGQPVLIATVTLGESEALSAELDRQGIAHTTLNARQDAEEADVVSRAGVAGAITVATSMAGRGTDIALDAASAAAGGLHVIIAGHHDASRVDRQIAGRCARQGDPGSVEFIVSVEDGLLDEFEDDWQPFSGSPVARLRRAQSRREARHARSRARMARNDWREDDLLGFSGKGE
ncbi:protein translocase subunit secA [Vreelandella subterranea]|uniref:Protein translocase subunit SecA n=1 Tax=Vreelandella subterranea TaxID=416874 RepID=A0A1H9VPX5_9GAMM|nr:preprotein translocase subunit SecA [Halomonas subterranea]SES23695.1 protein translocase subunit secA [Halomonas subterranea]